MRLIIKTPLTILYASVFFQLDCGYWSSEAEQHVRAAMASLPNDRVKAEGPSRVNSHMGEEEQ